MNLNSFKGQCCGLTKEYGKAIVRKGYWSGFMKRNGHMLNHIRLHKFGLDRTNLWKYGVFFDMCDSIGKELIRKKVMTMLEEPEWQDNDSNWFEF